MKEPKNPDWFIFVFVTAVCLGPIAYAVGHKAGKSEGHEIHRDVMRRINLPPNCETIINDAWEDWRAEQEALHDEPDPR